MAWLPDFLASKGTTNLYSVSLVHSGIVLPWQWDVKCNFAVTDDYKWLKGNCRFHSPGISSDGQYNSLLMLLVECNFDFCQIILAFKLSLYGLCQAPYHRAGWQFRYRKPESHWLVVLSKSHLIVIWGSTYQVLRWKHYLGIWIERKYFFDQKHP